MCNGSRARSFYINLMNMHACGKLNGNNDLVSRIRETCDKHDVSFLKYVFNKNYASHVRQNILRISQDGLSDSQWRINNGAIGARAPGPRAQGGPLILKKKCFKT